VATTRTRPISDWYTIRGNPKIWQSRYTKSTGVTVDSVIPATGGPGTRGRQITVSDNNAADWDYRTNRPKSPSQPVGGDFFTQRIVTWAPTGLPMTINTVVEDATRITTTKYHGPVYAYPPQIAADGLTSFASTPSALRQKGTVAIARCKPTNPVADSAVFLAELKNEGLPKLLGSNLWKSATKRARDAGDEYLNVEFGWKPLIGDIQDVISGVRRSNDFLSQYERDAGKLVRRRFEFPVEESSVAEPQASTTAVLDPDNGKILVPPIPALRLVKRTYSYRRIWFSGAFTYHMPTENWYSRSAIGKLGQQLDTVFGTSLSPEVIWNLAPWSWAVDWFGNLGDVIDNLSDWSIDGLVMKYGYVMEHTIKRVEWHIPGNGGLPSPYLFPSDVIAEIETKQRVVASPFGFGVSWDGLSPRQLAITAALGITRA